MSSPVCGVDTISLADTPARVVGFVTLVDYPPVN